MTAAELIEQGVRAYTQGQLEDAERCWRDVLTLEPTNVRALSYLELVAGRIAVPPEPSESAPVPLPARAASSVPSRAKPPPRTSAAPVALPRPGGQGPQAGGSPAPAPFSDLREDEEPRLAMRWDPEHAPEETTASLPAAPATSSSPGEAPGPDAAGFLASPWDDSPSRTETILVEPGAGLDLASVEEGSSIRALVPDAHGRSPQGGRKPRTDVEIWMDGARELFALGDFSGSLEMIERILKVDASHAEAREYLRQNETTLIDMYESKLGPPSCKPRLAIQPEEVMWLNLDHRAGFLLAQIDGSVSYDDLFALSGLPRLDTARILAALQGEGVIRS